MRKACLVAATLFLSVWVCAQTTSPTEQQSNPVQAGSQDKSGGGDAIEGCLAGAGGSFTLTDGSGKTYQLVGDTAKLNDHVGHAVRISGSQKNPGPDSSAQPTFTVQKVKMISSSCSASK